MTDKKLSFDEFEACLGIFIHHREFCDSTNLMALKGILTENWKSTPCNCGLDEALSKIRTYIEKGKS